MSTSTTHQDMQAKQLLGQIFEARPTLSHEQVLEICKAFRGGHWTSEEEEAAALEVAVSGDYRTLSTELEAVSKVHARTFARISKICMRLYRMAPFEMFSANNGISIRRSRINITDPSNIQHPFLWSRQVMSALCMVMLHPLFVGMGSPSFLILVLQFASICRTRDDRPWDMPRLEHENAIPQINALRDALPEPTASGDLMGRNAISPYAVLRELCGQIPSDSLSAEISLLLQIADIATSAKEAGTRANTNQYGRRIYEIYKCDIDVITRAISQVHPPQVSVKTANDIWEQLHQRSHPEDHPNANTSVETLKASYKHLETQRLLRDRDLASSSLPISDVALSASHSSELDAQPESTVVDLDFNNAPSLPASIHDTAAGFAAPHTPLSHPATMIARNPGASSANVPSTRPSQPGYAMSSLSDATTINPVRLPESSSLDRPLQHGTLPSHHADEAALKIPVYGSNNKNLAITSNPCQSPMPESGLCLDDMGSPSGDQSSQVSMTVESAGVDVHDDNSNEIGGNPVATDQARSPDEWPPTLRTRPGEIIGPREWYVKQWTWAEALDHI